MQIVVDNKQCLKLVLIDSKAFGVLINSGARAADLLFIFSGKCSIYNTLCSVIVTEQYSILCAYSYICICVLYILGNNYTTLYIEDTFYCLKTALKYYFVY